MATRKEIDRYARDNGWDKKSNFTFIKEGREADYLELYHYLANQRYNPMTIEDFREMIVKREIPGRIIPRRPVSFIRIRKAKPSKILRKFTRRRYSNLFTVSGEYNKSYALFIDGKQVEPID